MNEPVEQKDADTEQIAGADTTNAAAADPAADITSPVTEPTLLSMKSPAFDVANETTGTERYERQAFTGP